MQHNSPTRTTSIPTRTHSAAETLHRLLATTSLAKHSQLKREFCAWVACYDKPVASMFDLPQADQHILVRRLRSWTPAQFEHYISQFLAQTSVVVVHDVNGLAYDSNTLTSEQAQQIAADWLA
jgi:hypothetical protein